MIKYIFYFTGLLLFTLFFMIFFVTPSKSQNLCPGNNFDSGTIISQTLTPSHFLAGYLGIFDQKPDGTVEGHMNHLFGDYPATLKPANQLSTWWSTANNRNTMIHISNIGADDVEVHISLFKDTCQEVLDFCDSFEPGDSHIYDFSNLVRNSGGGFTYS